MENLEESTATLPAPLLEPSAREDAEEAAAPKTGLSGAKESIKPDRDVDFYVGWSYVSDAPTSAGTRAEALADGCPPSRLRRADESGTSALGLDGVTWDAAGLVANVTGCAGDDGWLARARLADYTATILSGQYAEAQALLEPGDGAGE